MAISTGSCEWSTWGRAMTTEVSSSPCRWRGSGMWGRVLVEHAVDLEPGPRGIDPRRGGERTEDHLRRNEPAAPKRDQLPHRRAVAGDDERLSLIEGPHDLAAVVPELSLSNLAHRVAIVALSLRNAPRHSGAPSARLKRPRDRKSVV